MAVDERLPEGRTPTPARRRQRGRLLLSRLRTHWMVALAVAALLLLVAGPLTYLFIMSLREGTPGDLGDWTLQNYRNGFTNSLTYEALRNTLLVALVATVIALTLAFFFAWLVERTDLPFQKLSYTILLLPIALPSILFVLAWVVMLSPRSGLINEILRMLLGMSSGPGAEGPLNIHSIEGVVFLDSMRNVTTAFLMLIAAFRLFDPTLEEAAKVSGAGTMGTVRRITVPILIPAIMAAAVYSFISGLDQFESALAAGLPGNVFLLPTLIFFTVQFRSPPDYGLGSVYSVMFMIVMIVLLLAYRWVVRRSERFVTVSGKAYRPQRTKLGRWRYPAFAVVALYGLFAVVLPVLMLLWISLRPPNAPIELSLGGEYTLDVYRSLFTDPQNLELLWNTVKMLVGTATLTMVIAFLVSWAVIRSKGRGRGLLDGMSFLPYAFPGVTIGVAAIIIFLNPPGSYVPIYGTVTILVLALTVQYVAFGTRLMNGAIAQVQSELEDAGRTSGAQYFSVLRRITLPLLAPAVISGWIWVAAHAMRTFSVPLLLSTRGNSVISPEIWHTWQRGDLPGAAAYGVLLTVLLIPLTILMRRLMVGAGGALGRG